MGRGKEPLFSLSLPGIPPRAAVFPPSPGPRPPLRTKQHSSTKETSAEERATLKKNILTSSERFTSVSYGFHFWIGSLSVGITFVIQFFQVQLYWSRRNLSLPIEHLFWIRFRQSAKWLSLHLRFALQY